ncbi:Rz1-like lysis system protein LysC [Stenotrophomonas maltophilia]|uniref:Rz1-like lysis system protein LysC n=1 Tax=Stenotrophomonas maltophilia TaxID=40324 RepID=UPI0034DB351D
MRRHSIAVILAAALPLCGFGSCSNTSKPDIPQVVYVTVEKPVVPPAELTQPCPITRAQERSVEKVVSAYNANILSLQQCNKQLGEIRELGVDQVKR